MGYKIKIYRIFCDFSKICTLSARIKEDFFLFSDENTLRNQKLYIMLEFLQILNVTVRLHELIFY